MSNFSPATKTKVVQLYRANVYTGSSLASGTIDLKNWRQMVVAWSSGDATADLALTFGDTVGGSFTTLITLTGVINETAAAAIRLESVPRFMKGSIVTASSDELACCVVLMDPVDDDAYPLDFNALSD